jgi:hypothetical protein
MGADEQEIELGVLAGKAQDHFGAGLADLQDVVLLHRYSHRKVDSCQLGYNSSDSYCV